MRRKRLILAMLTGLLSSILFVFPVYAGPRAEMWECAGASQAGLKYSRTTSSGSIVVPPGSPLSVGSIEGLEDAEPEPSAEADASLAWKSDMLEEKTLDKREEGLDIKGIIPSLKEEFGAASDTVNEQIDSIIAAKVITAKESRARSIDLEYTVYDTEELVSIVILFTIKSTASKVEVASVNFEPESGAILPLSRALPHNIVPLAEKLLTEKIRRNPEKFSATFDTLPENQAYYLTDGQIVLLFNEFSLAPGVDGVTKLEMERSRLAVSTITKWDYYTRPGFSLKMIPLGLICNDLGYEAVWNEETQSAEILHEGALVIELTPEVNNYLVRDKKVRSLEAAPELVKEAMYVPISFFDQILSLITYSVDDQENITFLSYMEAD